MLAERNCPFCQMVRGDLQPVLVYGDQDVLAIMDLYPSTRGHILVLPKQHIENIYALPPDLGAHIMKVAINIARAVKRELSPQGLNLIQSNELAAGQTIPHFHLHMVPRYKDDVVILKFGHGDTPAQQSALEPLAGKLRSALANE